MMGAFVATGAMQLFSGRGLSRLSVHTWLYAASSYASAINAERRTSNTTARLPSFPTLGLLRPRSMSER